MKSEGLYFLGVVFGGSIVGEPWDDIEDEEYTKVLLYHSSSS